MNDFKKERKKLEQTGFSGQTLEQALKLMEETGISRMLTKLLVASVVKQGKTPSMALYSVETMLQDKELIFRADKNMKNNLQRHRAVPKKIGPLCVFYDIY